MNAEQKELLQYLHSTNGGILRDRIEAVFPDLFPKLKNNVWYRYTDSDKHLVRFTNVDNHRGYGFDLGGYQKGTKWRIDKLVPATKEYIQEKFRAEAIKKGFKGGVEFKLIQGSVGDVNQFSIPNNPIMEFEQDQNRLIMEGSLGGYTIYKDNVWAEIVEEASFQKGDIVIAYIGDIRYIGEYGRSTSKNNYILSGWVCTTSDTKSFGKGAGSFDKVERHATEEEQKVYKTVKENYHLQQEIDRTKQQLEKLQQQLNKR